MSLSSTINLLASYFPWLPRSVIELLVDGYTDHGDANLALVEFRNSDQYDIYYPGNKRDDGTLRYDEMGYYSYIERGRIALSSVNVNPDLFEDVLVQALSSDIGIDSVVGRIDAIAGRVLDNSPAIRQAYQTFYGTDTSNLSDSALIAMALNPDLNDRVFSNQLTTAEIGGEAALRGFGINLELADAIRQRGFDRASSSQLFSAASEDVPVLEILSRRHNDPDDPFNIDDFVAGTIFDDPFERNRMRRLIAQERGLYSPGAGIRQDQGGSLVGLLPS